MNPIAINEYKYAMREAVCSVCVSFADNEENPGECVYADAGCTLFANLDELTGAISGIDSVFIEPYTEALREKVCAVCHHQDSRGVCDLRDARGPVPAWCNLDAYFNIIVGAVDDVQKTHAEKA